MASPLADAVVNSIASSMSPDARMTSAAIATFVKEKELELENLKSETIEAIERKLTAAIERQAHAAVIEAYSKMLSKVTA